MVDIKLRADGELRRALVMHPRGVWRELGLGVWGVHQEDAHRTCLADARWARGRARDKVKAKAKAMAKAKAQPQAKANGKAQPKAKAKAQAKAKKAKAQPKAKAKAHGKGMALHAQAVAVAQAIPMNDSTLTAQSWDLAVQGPPPSPHSRP